MAEGVTKLLGNTYNTNNFDFKLISSLRKRQVFVLRKELISNQTIHINLISRIFPYFALL